MNIIGFIFILVVIYFVKKSLEEKIERENSTVFFRIDFQHGNLLKHPFVVEKLIPFLKKNVFSEKQIDKEIEKIKDEWKEGRKKYPDSYSEKTNEEFEKIFWGRTIHKLFDDAVKKHGGEDRAIAFRLFNAGSVDNAYHWDTLYKSFSNEDPSFQLDLYEDNEFLPNKYVKVRGNKRFVEKDGEHFSVFSIYMEIVDREKMLNDDGKEYTEILIEIPKHLISWYRYTLFLKKKDYVEKMMNIFKLKDFNKEHEGDVYKDSLGDYQSIGKPGYTIGNDYVKFWIV